MKKYIFLLFMLVLSQTAFTADKPLREDVISYLRVTKTIELLESYAESYVTLLKDEYPDLGEDFYSDPEFVKAIEDYKLRTVEDAISIIQNSLSKEDLDQIVEFLGTNLGKKLIRLMDETDPLFLESGIKSNVWLNGIVGEILDKHEAR